MRKTVHTTYEIDDVKKLVKDVLKEQKVVTRNDLRTVTTKDDLKDFATKEDLKDFATKDDIDKFVTVEELKKTLDQYPTKVDLKTEITSLRDVIVQFKDDVLSEVKKIREDTLILTGYKDQIEDHETRLEKIEKLAFPE